MRPLLVAICTLSVTALGCGVVDTTDQSSSHNRGKMEGWVGTNDDPAYVDSSYVYSVDKLAELKVAAEGQTSHTPWPGDYWATASDSINVRWDGGNPSPAEKVAQAFDLPGFPAWITNNTGVYAHWTSSCDSSADCDGGDICAFPYDDALRLGDKPGRCIGGWWGLCHGWSAAAVAEPQPVNPVTHNSVTFYPGDLEALATLIYSQDLQTKFLSSRCNTDPADWTTDRGGRITMRECRDMNPGSMYVVLANRIGLAGQGLVEDKTAGSQVWNQPVRAYRVTNAKGGKLEEITKGTAIGLVGETAISRFIDWLRGRYPYNADAARFFRVQLELDYIVESSPSREAHDPDNYTRTDEYDFLLEADGDGNIIGGEWIGRSRSNHPDFMWWPVSGPTGNLGGLDYAKVKSLLDRSH